jgi:hypothetical protein
VAASPSSQKAKHGILKFEVLPTVLMKIQDFLDGMLHGNVKS